MLKTKTRPVRNAPLFEAVIMLGFMVLALAIGNGVLRYNIRVMLVLCVFVDMFIAKRCGRSWKEVMDFAGKKVGAQTDLFFMLLGMGFLMGTWVFSGTVPVIASWMVGIINPKFTLVLTFIFGWGISYLIGSNFTTGGTICLIMFNVAMIQGISAPLAAGAAVCGATAGSFISPVYYIPALSASLKGYAHKDSIKQITEALWGTKVSSSTISELNKKAYVHIEDWRNRPLQGGKYPYVYVDGIYLRRNWGGEYENVAILVAIAVNEDGYREVLGAAEGMKEDKASWVSFFQWLKGRGLDGVKLIVGDKCLGMLEAVGEVFPDAKYQRCTVHFYRNVFSVVPRSKVKLVAKMLKAIHAQESKKASREKARAVVAELKAMKLKEAARKVEDGIEETLTYCDFPFEHWTRIRTNNVIERLNREIRRRTRVVGCFPDGNSALMLVCARLRHVAGTQWGNKKYMNMKHLEMSLEDASIAG